MIINLLFYLFLILSYFLTFFSSEKIENWRKKKIVGKKNKKNEKTLIYLIHKCASLAIHHCQQLLGQASTAGALAHQNRVQLSQAIAERDRCAAFRALPITLHTGGIGSEAIVASVAKVNQGAHRRTNWDGSQQELRGLEGGSGKNRLHNDC